MPAQSSSSSSRGATMLVERLPHVVGEHRHEVGHLRVGLLQLLGPCRRVRLRWCSPGALQGAAFGDVDDLGGEVLRPAVLVAQQRAGDARLDGRARRRAGTACRGRSRRCGRPGSLHRSAMPAATSSGWVMSANGRPSSSLGVRPSIWQSGRVDPHEPAVGVGQRHADAGVVEHLAEPLLAELQLAAVAAGPAGGGDHQQADRRRRWPARPGRRRSLPATEANSTSSVTVADSRHGVPGIGLRRVAPPPAVRSRYRPCGCRGQRRGQRRVARWSGSAAGVAAAGWRRRSRRRRRPAAPGRRAATSRWTGTPTAGCRRLRPRRRTPAARTACRTAPRTPTTGTPRAADGTTGDTAGRPSRTAVRRCGYRPVRSCPISDGFGRRDVQHPALGVEQHRRRIAEPADRAGEVPARRPRRR